MTTGLYRATVFALYQFSVVLGIALLPVALVANRAGIRLPIDRCIERLRRSYERTAVGR